MATIDFPSSPTMGQEYPFGDFIYVWDGVKWTTKVIVGSTEESDARYVNSTGDTMTGALRLKTSGDNADLHHIRNDDTLAHTIRYVESLNLTQFVARDSAEVGSDYIAHYHETGDTQIKQPHSKSPQGTTAAALTRKDYVDTTFVKKAGDIVTGTLTVAAPDLPGILLQSTTPASVVRHLGADGSITAGFFHDTSSNKTHLDSYVDGVWQRVWLEHDAGSGNTSIYKPIATVSQQTDPAALTRKDYVDAALLVERTRIGELESVISTLTARIEALEVQVNLTSVM